MEGMELVNFTVLSWYPALETGKPRQSFVCRINPVVVYYIKNCHTNCRQPKQILLVPPTHSTSFGGTDQLQAFDTWYLKLKIKCIYILNFEHFIVPPRVSWKYRMLTYIMTLSQQSGTGYRLRMWRWLWMINWKIKWKEAELCSPRYGKDWRKGYKMWKLWGELQLDRESNAWSPELEAGFLNSQPQHPVEQLK